MDLWSCAPQVLGWTWTRSEGPLLPPPFPLWIEIIETHFVQVGPVPHSKQAGQSWVLESRKCNLHVLCRSIHVLGLRFAILPMDE